MILVSGATGQLGRATVHHLTRLGAKDKLAVLARDPSKAGDYAAQGIDVRQGDFDKPAELGRAFAGIDTLFFVSAAAPNRSEQQPAVVDAAKAAGVRNIVYTGVAMRDVASAATAKEMIAHIHTEDHIRASGLGHTLLRNTIYADVIPQFAGPALLGEGIRLPVGDGKAAFALRDELGEAAARVLLNDQHTGQTYQLTGPQAVSFGDIADALSDITGRPIPFHDIAPSVLAQQLKAFGVDDYMAGLILGTLEDIRSGQYDIVTDDLQTLLGRPPLALKTLLGAVIPELSAHEPSN
ncbi:MULTISPECIES: SDR family oxidoreductase [unclassified Brevundimonas]|uniref:SDR family oxidoreductase n=1 Tax=unclassified Brevundimonas TaxID=2622653 RepID=UPI0025C608FC|nr:MULTISPECIES: SDR family oxidoreductase [unclassified Brevundimonas]